MAADSQRSAGALVATALVVAALLAWLVLRDGGGDTRPERTSAPAARGPDARDGEPAQPSSPELAGADASQRDVAGTPSVAGAAGARGASSHDEVESHAAADGEDGAPRGASQGAPQGAPHGATRLELVVVPSSAWLEEGVPAHLSPALLRLRGALAAREPYLGEWRGSGWLFQIDGLVPGALELELATPSAPPAAAPFELELVAGDNRHQLELASRGHAVRVVAVWEDDSRSRVDAAFAATGVYSGLDTSGDVVPFAELLSAGTPVAVAPFEAVAPERFVHGDVFEARFDAVPDGDYEVRVACGFERHASLAAGATTVRVRMEDAYVRVPVELDLAWRAADLPLEVLVGEGALVPERLEVVAYGAVAGASGQSAILWRAESAVLDGVARFDVPADLREPRRVMLAADGAQPLFLDGTAVRLGGRLVARFEPGSGGLVLAGGRCGGRAAAPVTGLDLTWHGDVQRLDAFGALELASPAELPFDRSVLGAPAVWRALFGSRDAAPVRVDLEERGSVVLLHLRP
jgi:hypothetical protein